MNSRKEEERQRVEFGRRDANSVASRTRASKRVLGKQTSADEDEHGREGLQEHSQIQQAAGSEEDRATKSGEQRSVREKERNVREDPQSVREERLTQNVGQRQVRGIAQEVIMTRDLFKQAQEFEDKLTEEDLQEAGWSRDDVVLAMKMLFGEAEEVPEEEQDRLLHGMELVEREKRERRAREQEERERERENKEKERERQVRAAELARFKRTVVPWGRAQDRSEVPERGFTAKHEEPEEEGNDTTERVQSMPIRQKAGWQEFPGLMGRRDFLPQFRGLETASSGYFEKVFHPEKGWVSQQRKEEDNQKIKRDEKRTQSSGLHNFDFEERNEVEALPRHGVQHHAITTAWVKDALKVTVPTAPLYNYALQWPGLKPFAEKIIETAIQRQNFWPLIAMTCSDPHVLIACLLEYPFPERV